MNTLVLGLFLLAAGVISHVCATVQATYFASPTGSGTVCSREQPGSLESVRDKIRTVNTAMTGDIVVNLRGGKYTRETTFELGAQDSATNGYRIIYQALSGEEPVVSGGKQIAGFTLHDASRSIYKASVTVGWQFRQLYVDGVRCIRSREPDVVEAKSGGPYYTQIQSQTYPFVVNAAEVGSWTNLNAVEMVWHGIWAQKRGRIDRFDLNGTEATVRFLDPEGQDPLGYLNGFNQSPGRYYFENAYEFVNAPGEWYLDGPASVLYYKPRAAEDLSSSTVTAPTVETLWKFVATAGITITGIRFEYSNWTLPNTEGFLAAQAALMLLTTGNIFTAIPGAVMNSGSHDITVTNCTIQHAGAHGFVTVGLGHDNTTSKNIITDVSACGIVLGGDGRPANTEMVSDNLVAGFGQDYLCGVGILTCRVVNTTITHNEICNGPYSGISFGWSWDSTDIGSDNNDVSYNRIYQVLQALDDGGGIYTLGRMNNTAIHHNYISNLARSPYASGCPLAGIYLDAGSCYKRIENNVLDSCNNAFYSFNLPNYNNMFQYNYYNCELGKMSANNTVGDNVPVTGSSWPIEARAIIASAGRTVSPTKIRTHPPASSGIASQKGQKQSTVHVFDLSGRLIFSGTGADIAHRRTRHHPKSAIGARSGIRIVRTVSSKNQSTVQLEMHY